MSFVTENPFTSSGIGIGGLLGTMFTRGRFRPKPRLAAIGASTTGLGWYGNTLQNRYDEINRVAEEKQRNLEAAKKYLYRSQFRYGDAFGSNPYKFKYTEKQGKELQKKQLQELLNIMETKPDRFSNR